MNQEHLTNLIRDLEHVARRPSMYLGKADIQAAIFFLQGFGCALQSAFGLNFGQIQRQVIVDRGWDLPKATGPGIEHQMIQRGKTPAEVIEELVAIQIDVLRQWK
jgi:hypothetical protein